MSIEPWNTGTDGFAGCEDMPRKFIDIKFPDYPIQQKRGATAPFSCLPARMGSGEARYWVKGLVPCRFLGQRPKPSESLLELISAIFKVHLSLFLWLCFFITYLTLPSADCLDLLIFFSVYNFCTKLHRFFCNLDRLLFRNPTITLKGQRIMRKLHQL